ncbi:hypothetical protein INT43_002669 [Umbelopsis isabellina]|uniref:Uncharacterized protein n=1 Tax=Mortierella isabellina TaxID=91625 RepID=A0A8H7UHN9_MORIS|nr:hypothetical protein INT43_002669 [Umbelopsis isabellina]
MTEQNERLPLKPPKDCELAEILQYQCEIGVSQVVCNPFVRVFAKCKGFPLYEITPSDEAEEISDTSFKQLPKMQVIDELKTPPGVVAADAKNTKE